MRNQDIKSQVANLSGLTNDEALAAAIQAAVVELWNTIDIPGTLQEIRVETNDARFVTLPWQVYKIRGAKSAEGRVVHEINTIHPYYHDYGSYQSEYDLRLLRYVPIAQRITNASTLTFKLRKIQSTPVEISITGEVDYASRVVEPVTIHANSRSCETVERYIGIPDSITKTYSHSDVDILDCDGVVLGTIPNHLSSSRYLMAQMYDRCTTVVSMYNGLLDVLFKPHPPVMTADDDDFPDPFSQIVVYKALEQLKLAREDELDKAAAYNEKAKAVLQQFEADSVRGKTLKQNIKLDRLTTHYHGRI